MVERLDMRRATEIQFEFVESVPDQLQPATLYISIPFRTTSHLCLCGCGEKIVNPLRPNRWALRFDGSTVSISPSIGNSGIRCKSHYWIENNRVQWRPPMTREQSASAMQRDGWRSTSKIAGGEQAAGGKHA
nr:DUF6527 family protein [Actinomycetota bacterium]